MNPRKKKQVRVLIVDDHPVVRDGIRANLEDATHIEVVGEAATAEEAIERARELEPDVVILDMKLPGSSGLKVTEELGREVPDARVLILSMYSERSYVLEAVRRGARGYVLKDSAADELANAVTQVWRGGAFFDANVSDYLLHPEDGDEMGGNELSPRETEVLTLVAEGLSNKEIAAKLFLSVRTVEAHRENIMRKLDIRGTAALTRYAIEHGLVEVNIEPGMVE